MNDATKFFLLSKPGSLRCDFCTEPATHYYAVTIDGDPLHLQAKLCQEHGDRFVLRHGMLLGTLMQKIEGVFVGGKGMTTAEAYDLGRNDERELHDHGDRFVLRHRMFELHETKSKK